ncbi:MAG TPA: hypothetical protein VGE12_16685 [Noviherbaspirillum sp.]
MHLHQIQVTYRPDEDRILCRASFKAADGGFQELRAWLTRRLTRLFWAGIIDALEKQIALDKPQASHASADIVGMEYHASIEEARNSGSFGTPYKSEEIATFPLGETPILVSSINFSLNAGQPIRVNLTPATGSGFEIAFSQQVLHSFCSLLREAVSKAEWDLELHMPGTSPAIAGSRVLN